MKPAHAFFTALRHGTILISLVALQELSEVLGCAKFDKYLTLDEREQFLGQFTTTATTIDIMETIHVCRDPKDDMFLDSLSSTSRYTHLTRSAQQRASQTLDELLDGLLKGLL